jgi:hypothetical protein
VLAPNRKLRAILGKGQCEQLVPADRAALTVGELRADRVRRRDAAVLLDELWPQRNLLELAVGDRERRPRRVVGDCSGCDVSDDLKEEAAVARLLGQESS